MKIEANQSKLRGGQRLPTALLYRIGKQMTKEVKKTKGENVSLAFVSDQEIKKLNKTYRGKDCVTDVLSFPYKEKGMAGDIVISYEQAKRQAKEVGHTARNELVFLIVHGALHVFGYDHMKPADKKKMFSLQSKILTTLGVDPRI
jgi:probable rRNA maturation factor